MIEAGFGLSRVMVISEKKRERVKSNVRTARRTCNGMVAVLGTKVGVMSSTNGEDAVVLAWSGVWLLVLR